MPRHEKLTETDRKKIQGEIDHRKLVVRPQAIADLKEARAQGDLSENFEYHAAKRFKNQNESRIRYLENMLKNAVTIEDHSAADQVGLNKIVRIRFEDEEETEEFKIVTAIRGNSLEGRITPESPLGKALMGHRPGDTVHVVPEGGTGYDVTVELVSAPQEETEEIRKY